jgi:hypothetical protein
MEEAVQLLSKVQERNQYTSSKQSAASCPLSPKRKSNMLRLWYPSRVQPQPNLLHHGYEMSFTETKQSLQREMMNERVPDVAGCHFLQ